MTSFHKSGGVFTRCRAKTRRGFGVELCPVGDEAIHYKGLEGIAAAGGGILRRWVAEDTYRETEIYVNDDGTFTAETNGRKSVFTMAGERVKFRARPKPEGNADKPQSQKTRAVEPVVEPEREYGTTPTMRLLLNISNEDWYNKPVSERKKITEKAFFELREAFGLEVEWKGWDNSEGSLARTFFWSTYNRLTGVSGTKVEISFSKNSIVYISPANVADTLVHELAHVKAGHECGHGHEWERTFAALQKEADFREVVVEATHSNDEVEQEYMELERIHRKWRGLCPQGHQVFRRGKPRATWLCGQCRELPTEQRIITFGKNPNYDKKYDASL